MQPVKLKPQESLLHYELFLSARPFCQMWTGNLMGYHIRKKIHIGHNVLTSLPALVNLLISKTFSGDHPCNFLYCVLYNAKEQKKKKKLSRMK